MTVNIPLLDTKIALLIEKIRGMDDSEFSKFISLVLNYVDKEYKVKGMEVGDILVISYAGYQSMEIEVDTRDHYENTAKGCRKKVSECR